MAKTNLAIHPGIIALLWRVSSCVIGPRRSAAQVAACTATATPEWRRDTHFKLSVFILTVGLVFFVFSALQLFCKQCVQHSGLERAIRLRARLSPALFFKRNFWPSPARPAGRPARAGNFRRQILSDAKTYSRDCEDRTKDQSIAVQMSYHSTTTCL